MPKPPTWIMARMTTLTEGRPVHRGVDHYESGHAHRAGCGEQCGQQGRVGPRPSDGQQEQSDADGHSYRESRHDHLSGMAKLVATDAGRRLSADTPLIRHTEILMTTCGPGATMPAVAVDTSQGPDRTPVAPGRSGTRQWLGEDC